MIKRTFAISAIALSSLLSLQTMALVNNPSYVSAQAGVAMPHGKLAHETIESGGIPRKSLRTAAVFDIYVGTKVYTNTYAELEFAYAQHNFRSNYKDTNFLSTLQDNSFTTKLRTMTGFANLNYKFQNLSTMVIPYIVAGVGASSNRVHNMSILVPSHDIFWTSKGKSTIQAAWQVGAGVLVPVAKNVSINLSYKYRDLGRIKTTNVFTDHKGVNDGTAGQVLAGRIRASNILFGVAVDL
jgi:opacity protein-like surface antigen